MIFQHLLALSIAVGLPVCNSLMLEERTASITQTFQRSLSRDAQIFLATDPNYSNSTTQRWTLYEEPTYAAAIIPALASDVQAIVRISSRYYRVATRGGSFGSTKAD
jgi:hypothetical protein